MQEPSSREQGRVGIHVETTTFAVAPGDRVTIPVVLSNYGLERDILTLAVEGIPTSWVYASSASTPLDPGQEQVVTLAIQPSHTLQAGAGLHPFRIQVKSQLAPGQVFEVECTLSIAAFAEFSSELRPQRVEAGEPARVTIENRGNIQQAYTLTCQSPENALAFEPSPSQQMRVPPGEMRLAEFRATPRNRPFFGGEVSFPFTARVQSADMAVQNHNGEVVSRALIPTWVIPVVLVLIIVTACAAALLLLWAGSPGETPDTIPGASSTPAHGVPAPTEAPPEVPPEGQPTMPPGASATPPPEQPAPTEPPPEQPTEPPPEQPTEPPPDQPTEPPPEQPTDEGATAPGEPSQPCSPLAFGLILVPLLVAIKKREL